jgi:hypothetical protein
MIDGLVEGKNLRQYELRMFVFSWIWVQVARPDQNVFRPETDRLKVRRKLAFAEEFRLLCRSMGQNFPTSRAINSVPG